LQYQFLAEGFVALSVTTALIWILLLDRSELMEQKRFLAISILLFSIPFFALSYVYIALILYLMLAVKLFSHKFNYIKYLAILGLPYALMGFYLIASGTFKQFLFQNLTFNAKYYALFSGATNTNPLKAGLDIAATSLQQITTVLLHPFQYPLALLLLISFMLLPYALYSRRGRINAALLTLLLLFANSRVELYGVPAIREFSSISHHAELYRTLAILSLSISLGLLLANKYKNTSHLRHPLQRAKLAYAIPALSIILGTGFLYYVGQTKPLASIRNISTIQNSQPSAEVSIINEVTSPNDYAWIGPISFLDQSFLEAKIATNYTFFMPWHQICTSCHEEFYQQLEQQKPLVISWKKFGGVPSYPTPSYAQDIESYLKQNYFQVANGDPRFANLYFLQSDRTNIMRILRDANYL
jgi:hypothetical protein